MPPLYRESGQALNHAGVAVRAAALGAAALLVVFLVGVISAWARGLQIDCGCFGGGGEVAAGETAYGTEVVRDVVLLAVALALARWPSSRLALGGAAEDDDVDPCDIPTPAAERS